MSRLVLDMFIITPNISAAKEIGSPICCRSTALLAERVKHKKKQFSDAHLLCLCVGTRPGEFEQFANCPCAEENAMSS